MIDAGQRAMDRKRQRDAVILAILSVVVVGMAAYRLMGRSDATSVLVDSAPGQAVAHDPVRTMPRVIPVTWPLDVSRNPFRHDLAFVDQSVAPPPELPRDDWGQEVDRLIHLQGIVDNGEPSAMINGMLYHTGEIVAGYRIKQIQDRRVIVEREGVAIEIGL